MKPPGPDCIWETPPTSTGERAKPRLLTEEQKEHFLQHGWLHLTDCFTKEQSDWVVGDVWTRLGMDANDRSTWATRTNMPSHRAFDPALLAPKAWSAILELCGGEGRVADYAKEWRDSLIVNLGSPEYEGKAEDPKELDNWHVDGDFFVHYLDSAEQALLVIPLFSDIEPNGGGTMISPEGLRKVAKHLHDHPEGVSPRMNPRGHPLFEKEEGAFIGDLVQTCDEFVEVTGKTGDVYLLHPLMVHSATRNPLRNLRIITNPPVSFKEPQCFDREDGDYNLVEKTTLRALGKDSLPGWTITAPREMRIPERLKMQARMKEEELKRMQQQEKQSEVATATA